MFAALAEEEPARFYLTDFLVRHFDALVIQGLGSTASRNCCDDYFGNYRRLVHLAQFDDPDLAAQGEGRGRAPGSGLRAPLHRLWGISERASLAMRRHQARRSPHGQP